jgi:hypothetical protein
MKIICFLFFPIVLSGCVRVDPSTTATKEERVYTVNEFLAQPELRKKFFTVCSDDPGRTEHDPNCINVVSAERIASAGSTIPSLAP